MVVATPVGTGSGALLVRSTPWRGGGRATGYPAARDALLRLALAAAGLDLASTDPAWRRRCASCGGVDHGKPEVPAALAAGRHVSVAHTSTRLVVAVSGVGPCGVDVEDVAAVARAPVAAVLLAPQERVATGAVGGDVLAELLARTWVRKEALLKATGHGLAVDPARLVLGPAALPPQMLRWDGPGPAPEPKAWLEAELPAGPDGPRAVLSAVALSAP
jgi:4'-phosphopantetheinyl transferase